VPIYEFSCADCGSFDLTRPVAESGAPARCPMCGGEARRVFSPPNLALLATGMRGALDREEKSAHEPGLVTEKQGRRLPHKHELTPPWVAH
jgi:putative FmdB family regulatory protein